ncbi:hypothetical protein CN918_29285 [Priestia megaterium]|nr:hypothetical protein CN918_29285 [Priestia megaterium]
MIKVKSEFYGKEMTIGQEEEQLLSQVEQKISLVRRFLNRDIKSENPKIKSERLDEFLSGEEKKPLQLFNLSANTEQAIELLKLFEDYRKNGTSLMEVKAFLGDLELFLDDEKVKA